MWPVPFPKSREDARAFLLETMVTPLLVEITELQGQVAAIREGRGLDALDSLSHVRILGLFQRVYNDNEIMGELGWLQGRGRGVLTPEEARWLCWQPAKVGHFC